MTDASFLRIAFRVDAALEIGTGHVMRCLTLADALRARGAECLFLCRPHPGNLIEQIASRGHRVLTLAPPQATAISMAPDDPVHASWLGASWREDAAQTVAALAGEHVDWLVIDHYALDHRWERALRPTCDRLMVMDDLADRVHDCDLLLDPSLGREQAHYEPLVPNDAVLLLGPLHALLRPEFAAYRAESLASRKTPTLRHLLVTMGGVDQDNATGNLLAALDVAALPPELRITAVMGPHAPWLREVEAQAALMSVPTLVRVGVDDMARLMTQSDLAIGAGGGTSWERCCLGLPSFVICLAQNQFGMAATLQRSGAAIVTISPTETIQLLVEQIATGSVTSFLARTSEAAACITDGLGANRACDRMLV
ncbi:UDP-2,4-diacetamido-2,4,6-trideoxy-beta-L-altropyranose hydrolase [Sphingobium baderi]|uniref:Glycosyl transferase family 28 C-terminal domain-containing protein n=1 Tax=Sphingobium baderi LL03 TaxID=1114964 RepID=T0GXV0_9SPHN|nr:UDP-2,4-diacetamido-2,4,6-trideoxy-beta-L-altropyranose hydrolase [Sphingobium baderi]EQB04748.1 hypothetical protein L485_03885 [Sphingobium baderi LL03]KMS52225.1 hypothetical protein V475_22230 [Sphingobium baderi LL03]